MIAYKWIACTIGFLAIASSEIGMSQTNESACTIKLFDHESFNGRIRVQWSSNTSTTFEPKGTEKWLSETIKLPADAKEVQIEGTLTWKYDQSRPQKSSGVSKCRLEDFTAVVSPLRAQESWGTRMDKFVKELTKLENQHEDRDGSPSEQIDSNGRVPPDQIKAAEERLKFALPEEHKQLLQDYGAWDFSDSFCVAIDDINRADKQMRSIWGSPASEFASLSQENKVLYQSSTMLFVEAGDGYGALIYHPTSSGGEYFWIHQDELDNPRPLRDKQGKPRDYSSTMRWVIANQILMRYEDVFTEYTFIDRSSPTALPYQLRIDFPAPKHPLAARPLEARLDVDWAEFE